MRGFIHIVNDTGLVRDGEGEDFADLHAAAQHVTQVARDLMAEELRKGNPLPVRWKVLLTTADDTVLLSLPFTDLIRPTKPLPRYARPQSQQFEATELSDADRHIMDGRARVELQKRRIAQMQELGWDTSVAKDLLMLFEKNTRAVHLTPRINPASGTRSRANSGILGYATIMAPVAHQRLSEGAAHVLADLARLDELIDEAKVRVFRHAAHSATLEEIPELYAVSRKLQRNLEEGLRLLMHQRDHLERELAYIERKERCFGPPFQIWQS